MGIFESMLSGPVTLLARASELSQASVREVAFFVSQTHPSMYSLVSGLCTRLTVDASGTLGTRPTMLEPSKARLC